MVPVGFPFHFNVELCTFRQSNFVMKKWRFILSVFALISCKNETNSHGVDTSDFVTHTIADKYSIQTPKYMRETAGLNPDADIQLKNDERDVYLVIIEEPKQEVIANFKSAGVYNEDLSPAANYLNIQSHSLTRNTLVLEKSNPIAQEIGGMSALNMELMAQIRETPTPIYYLLTFVEGEETLYMIMQWTLESGKDEFKATFETIAATFEEM